MAEEKKEEKSHSHEHIKFTSAQKKAAKLFTVWNKGTAGVREMADALIDDQIMFGLLQVKVGKGTFIRTKNLFLHFNAMKFPSAVKRSKIREKYLPAAKTLFGHVHATLLMEQKLDCTVREVFTQTKGCFVEDDLGNVKKKGWTIEKMEKEYDKKMRAKLRKVQKEEGTLDTTDPKQWKGKRLIKELHEEHSPINWALFHPHKKLLKPMAFGMGDLSHLRTCLRDDMVQYALIRMSFGSGSFRRSHWVFLHWSGENMKGIKKMTERAEHNSYQKFMGEKMSPWGMVVTCNSKEQVSLEEMILQVRKLVVVDGKDDYKFDSSSYFEALEESKKVIQTKQEKVEEAKKRVGQELDKKRMGWKVEDSVKLVAAPVGDDNWILLKPKV